MLIHGGQHADKRGTLFYFNDFDLTMIRRFYRIDHPDTKIFRAWQGHKVEQKWFYCTKGIFEIKIIEINNWENPNLNKNIEQFVLEADKPMILHIPGGYVNGFRALVDDSSLVVYSDKTLEESKNDDYRFLVEQK